jgi:hypothetical protein
MLRLSLFSQPFQNQPKFRIDNGIERELLHGTKEGNSSPRFVPKAGQDIPQAHP